MFRACWRTCDMSSPSLLGVEFEHLYYPFNASDGCTLAYGALPGLHTTPVTTVPVRFICTCIDQFQSIAAFSSTISHVVLEPS